jgi:DNA-binding transcriptional LysR family regulator
MRFGVTPSLRGNFTKTAARITTEDGGFGRFDLVVSVNSNELIDLLLTHNITAAIVNEQSILGKEDLFNITNLFTEEFVWAVPKEIHPDIIKKILLGKFNYEDNHDALNRYVEINQASFNNISLNNDNLFNFQNSTDEWYRRNLSLSTPFYRASTYRMAIDFVAEGIATCHCPFSLIQGLEEVNLERINWIRIGGIKRTVVLAMPKHVMSLPSFKKFREKLIEYSRDSFNESEVSKVTLDIDQ